MFMFTLNNVFGKEAMNRKVGFASFIELTLVRMWFMAIASYIWLQKLNISVTAFPANLKYILFARCFTGAVNYLVVTIAIKLMPLSISMIITSTNPFITALLQYFWINLMITTQDAISMIGSFAGIVLIAISAPPTTNNTLNVSNTQN